MKAVLAGVIVIGGPPSPFPAARYRSLRQCQESRS
jgi:hypothetical protein